MSLPAGRERIAAVAETVAALAVVAWVGGMVALGAFTARIVFRDLPRALAAPTMSTIFRSFDGLIVAALVLLGASAATRLWALGLRGRADRIALAAAGALLALGILDVGFVHPAIARMFDAGRTLEPQFRALHQLSSRAVNLEVLVSALLLGAYAFARKAAS
jgi:hypothetical protein